MEDSTENCPDQAEAAFKALHDDVTEKLGPENCRMFFQFLSDNFDKLVDMEQEEVMAAFLDSTGGVQGLIDRIPMGCFVKYWLNANPQDMGQMLKPDLSKLH